jgi:hypothetical protein
VLKVPEGQALQLRSWLADPSELTNSPGSQWPKGAQVFALTELENVPEAQAVQTRSVVAVPALAKKPGAHSVHGTQGLAAFWSSSQVPAAHALSGAEPPAQ